MMERGAPSAMTDGRLQKLVSCVDNLDFPTKVRSSASSNNNTVIRKFNMHQKKYVDLVHFQNVVHSFSYGVYSDAVARTGAYYGQGSGAILLDDVSCSGFENKLIDCTHRGIGINDCVHYEDAGVVCVPLPNITITRNSEPT